MIKKLSIFILTCAIFTSFIRAEDGPRLTVIELFTSQGCSSCPPADAILKSIRDKPGTLTLSWAVDYWDRLGWKDTFGTPYNSMRQTAYNKRLGLGGVFTPQMIMDGRTSCVASKPEKVKGSLKKTRAIKRDNITPHLTTDGSAIFVALPKQNTDKPITVRIVWYLADAEVDIMSGENNGRTLHYTNIVRATDILADNWQGDAQTLKADIGKDIATEVDHVAILLQEEYGHGAIIGAANLKLPL